MDIVVFLGPPGCGKGTQAELLRIKYGFLCVSTGRVFREEVRLQTPLGQEIEALLDRGELVPDELVWNVMRKMAEGIPPDRDRILFDGFPRNLNQAKLLPNLWGKTAYRLKVLRLVVSDDSVKRRVEGRVGCSQCSAIYNEADERFANTRVCENCGNKNFVKRSDDNDSTFKTRMALFHEEMDPVFEYYKNKGVSEEINADQAVNDVHLSIASEIEKMFSSSLDFTGD